MFFAEGGGSSKRRQRSANAQWKALNRMVRERSRAKNPFMYIFVYYMHIR